MIGSIDTTGRQRAHDLIMALKNKTHDVEKAAVAQRTPLQKHVPAADEHQRPMDPATALKLATSAHPSALRPADVLTLQGAIGNRAVQRILSSHAHSLSHSSSTPANPIQRQTEEEELLRGELEAAPGKETLRENRTGMPDRLKSGVESLSGISLDHVRVHYNSGQPALLDALAYTRGSDIHVGPGQEQHLAHEAWHVVQQEQGRVSPTMQMAGTAINDDPALEQEADVMGLQAMQMTSPRRLADREAASLSPGAVREPGARPVSGVAQHFAGTFLNAVQRVRLNKAQLFDKTLGEFDQHTKYEQLDWANVAAVTADERELVWALLDKVLDKGLDGIKISQFVTDIGTDKPKLGQLLAYCLARVGKYNNVSTVTLGAAADLDEALKWGKWVAKLSGALTGPLVKAVIPEEAFKNLIADEAIAQRFLDYVAACNPILETPEGREAISFVRFDTEGGKYTDYNVDLPEVRNYHKFTKAALDQVKINKADTSKAKPLTLVLHSFYDHNGAFHRHARVNEVLTNLNILSLLYENLAQPKLDDLKGGGLEALAKKYGKGDKITQVMIAGHGNFNIISMGGSGIEVKDDKAVEKGPNYLLLDPSYSAFSETVKFWDAFFKELGKHMGAFDDGGTAFEPAVLLRACLTNSNSVENQIIKQRVQKNYNVNLDNPLVDPKAHQDKIKKEVVDYINESGSLTAQIESKYSKGAFKVLGANASISSASVGAVKPTGELGFVSASDPKVGGSKLEYVAEGHEPLGVMRAVVQSWAANEVACKLAMVNRLKVPAASWQDRLILLLFALATNQLKDDLLQVNLLTKTASNLYEAIGVDAHRRVSEFDGDRIISTYPTELIGGMLAAVDLPDPQKVKLVLYEYWMLIDAPKSKEFLESLGDASFNRARAKEYVDFKKIGPTVSFLLDNADGGAAQDGKRLLAVLDVFHGAADAKSIKLIKDAATGNAGTLPANISNLLGGFSENDMLAKVGLPPAVIAPLAILGQLPPPAKVNNVDTNGDGVNDAYVAPMTPVRKQYTGLHIFGRAKRVMSEPREGSTKLADTYTVLVVGEVKDVVTDVSKDWYAVRHDGKLGYVQTRNLADM